LSPAESSGAMTNCDAHKIYNLSKPLEGGK
jgi:hypothetical protein